MANPNATPPPLPDNTGNDHARQGRLWREAIKRALARAHGTVSEGLDKVADKLVVAARSGDKWAVEHIADRIDGKPPQSITHLGDEDHPLITERRIVYVDGPPAAPQARPAK